ncbi:uncharacterized protein ELE39_002956 [Cryptosporidium sp. chipmunk genotype I]|uniref:uncharacterized protein n=1 Tax=Cryptosporidium sp. chipmunk genotype I TaxID=1280935 RepID=UPI00351A5794|nr:hypothetical protein ELE39_002956 [Cryptosporidium sp. chipmunk genotype I]
MKNTKFRFIELKNELKFCQNKKEIHSLQVVYELLDKRNFLYKRSICVSFETLEMISESQEINVKDEVVKFV